MMKHVTYFPYKWGPHKDECVEYEGELIRENDDWIELIVWDTPMTFPKDRTVVTAARRRLTSDERYAAQAERRI